ncbi:hypothetical protein C1646_758828 [Rhizophagus diaphanus]|nr:hypothetical protein C1646_758828 [Rhizophagus diaphanus] [Rhizophagus sp. MUCL 43196]
MSPFRKFFRQNLSLSVHMPTAIIEYNLIYNIKNVADNQLQAKVLKFPFENNLYKKLFYKRNYSNWILKNIKLLKNYQIDISVGNIINTAEFKITEGNTSIRNINENNKFFKHILRSNLQEMVTVDSKTLKSEYRNIAIHHLKEYNKNQCEINRDNISKNLTYIGIWNNAKDDIEIGVLIKKSGIDDQQSLIIGHTINIINNNNINILVFKNMDFDLEHKTQVHISVSKNTDTCMGTGSFKIYLKKCGFWFLISYNTDFGL